MQKSTKNIIVVIVLIIFLILLIYFVADYQRRKVPEGMMNSPLGQFNPKELRVTEPLKRIPLGTISIKVKSGGFEPKEFTVKKGEVVALVLTGLDGTHGIIFEDKVLEKVKLYIGRNETRGIPFVAPKAGDYIFYCDIPGHRPAGETGVMHVK